MLNKGHLANFKIVAFVMPTVQLLTSKTLGSLIQISPDFHTMYSSDCRLNYEIRIVIFQSISKRQVANE